MTTIEELNPAAGAVQAAVQAAVQPAALVAARAASPWTIASRGLPKAVDYGRRGNLYRTFSEIVSMAADRASQPA